MQSAKRKRRMFTFQENNDQRSARTADSRWCRRRRRICLAWFFRRCALARANSRPRTPHPLRTNITFTTAVSGTTKKWLPKSFKTSWLSLTYVLPLHDAPVLYKIPDSNWFYLYYTILFFSWIKKLKERIYSRFRPFSERFFGESIIPIAKTINGEWQISFLIDKIGLLQSQIPYLSK